MHTLVPSSHIHRIHRQVGRASEEPYLPHTEVNRTRKTRGGSLRSPGRPLLLYKSTTQTPVAFSLAHSSGLAGEQRQNEWVGPG